MELKSIGVLSCGKLLGLMYAIIGLILGGFMALASLLGAANQPQIQGEQGAVMMGMGVAAVFLLPLLYGIGGFIGGIISAFLYNLLAGFVGGIEFNFERSQDQY